MLYDNWGLSLWDLFIFIFIFIFMHLADAFIQSDLQCIQAIHFFISMPSVLFHLSYYPPGESYLGKFKSFPVQFHFRKSH